MSKYSLDEIRAQQFSGVCIRSAVKEGRRWHQYFVFRDPELHQPGDPVLFGGPKYRVIDTIEFTGLTKVGPSAPYEREFHTDDPIEEVVQRLFPPVTTPRKRASKPLGELPTPFELLKEGPTAAAADRLSRYGMPGLTNFETALAELVEQTDEGGVDDSRAYWLGWLITQGEAFYRQHCASEPGAEDSWDPEVGEAVLMFPEEVRAIVDPGYLLGQEPAPAEVDYAEYIVDIEQRRLDEAYINAQRTPAIDAEALAAFQRGERGPNGGWPFPEFEVNPRTNAWFVAQAQPGIFYSARFLSNNGRAFVESVAYFLVRDGESPAKIAADMIDERTQQLGTTLLRQEGPFRVTDSSIPRWGKFYHQSYGGNENTYEALRTRLYLD